MEISFQIIPITKRYPLTISRGTSTGSNNLFVSLTQDGVTGMGECAPGTGFDESLAAVAQASLTEFWRNWDGDCNPSDVWQSMFDAGIDPAAMAGVDIALWDWLAKTAKMPLYRLLGLPKPKIPTSVTAGINPPEIVRERAAEFLERTGAKALKVKLGNPAGIEADKAQYIAASEAAQPYGSKLRVDANGGWEPSDAVAMIAWLAERGCDYVEQPLARGREDELETVFDHRKLPIFLDESIRTSQDVVRFANRCDGINLKLMKTGGITEALRLVATARAYGLQTMIGCMGETSLAIAAGAAIGALFDHIDLDSHLNLNPDPVHGLGWTDGVVHPTDEPGLGVAL